jgi:hypothetical protein
VTGYYRIREGRAFILTTDEIDAAESRFANAGSVVLLIERRPTGPAQGTFYFWKAGAFVYNLPFPFPIDPVALAAEERLRAPVAVAPLHSPAIECDEEPPQPPLGRTGRIAVLAGAGVAAAVLLAGWLRPTPVARETVVTAEPAAPAVAAAVAPHARGELEITWDPHEPPVSTAMAGMLRIDDGGLVRQMSLDFRDLQYGSAVYAPATDRVQIELATLQTDGKTVKAAVSTRATGVPELPTKVEAVPPPASEPEGGYRIEVQTPKSSAISPPRPFSAPPVAESPTATAGELDARAVAARPQTRPFTLGTADRAAPAATLIPDAPPAGLPSTAGPNLTFPPAVAGTVRAPAPPSPAPSVSSPQPARAVSHSGRLIWTGTLLRRGVVELEGRSATLGSLTGALPGVPANFTISPAEFGGDGLVVYTTEMSRNNRMEPPDAGNGWNKLRFVWDPERAHQLAVLEAPNAANHFSRLALRSDARRCSMILIDWVAR